MTQPKSYTPTMAALSMTLHGDESTERPNRGRDVNPTTEKTVNAIPVVLI